MAGESEELSAYYQELSAHSPYEAVVLRVREARTAGKRVLMFTGFYDLVHSQHVDSIEEARRMATLRHETTNDTVFVVGGVEPDWMAEYIKGSGRPIIDQAERVRLLSKFRAIDLAFAITRYSEIRFRPPGYAGRLPYVWHADYAKLLQDIQPDDIVLAQQAENFLAANAAALALKIGVITLTHDVTKESSTQIIQRAKSAEL